MRAGQDGAYRASDVLTIRYEGPKGGADMRAMLSTTSAVYGQRMGGRVALITGGRFFGGTPGFCVGDVRPGGAAGRLRGCGMATAS